MKARRWLPLTLILFLTALSLMFLASLRTAWQGGKQTPLLKPQTVAFVGVNVVPMDRERVLTGQTVVVKEGRIAALGPADQTAVPKGALRVDGQGKYLLPGLADMHVHLEDDEAVNQAMLQLFVANGVTTILNLYGTPRHLELRRRLARNDIPGPTLYTSGPFISDAPNWSPTPEEAERLVVEQKRAGYDFIKIHGDFSREAYRRLFVAARREGIRVIGHAPRNLSLEAMFEERQDAVAHAEEFLETYFFRNVPAELKTADLETKKRYMNEQIKKIPEVARATANAGLWMIPSLSIYSGIAAQLRDLDALLRRPEMQYLPNRIAAEWQPARNRYTNRFSKDRIDVFELQTIFSLNLVKSFHEAGVKMLAGTDTPVPCAVPGFSLHDELKGLVAAGLSPYEALRAATINAAEFLGALEQSGTVAVGKRADLILLDSDPLKDIRNTTKLTGVMVGGSWLPETELRRMLDKLIAR